MPAARRPQPARSPQRRERRTSDLLARVAVAVPLAVIAIVFVDP